MPLRCRTCDATFGDHLVVAARARKHWRGKSFDAEQARGDVGLALLDALAGPDADLDAFLATVRVEAFREDPAGTAPWRGEAQRDEGEDWTFHLGFHRPLEPTEREAAAEAAVKALAAARGFRDPIVVEDPRDVTVAPQPTDDEEGADDGDRGDPRASVDSWRNPALDGGD